MVLFAELDKWEEEDGAYRALPAKLSLCPGPFLKAAMNVTYRSWGSPEVKLPVPCCPSLASQSPITTATTSQEGLVFPLQSEVQPILTLHSGMEGVRGKSDGQGKASPVGHRWQTGSCRTQPCWGGGLVTYGRGAFLGPELPLLPSGTAGMWVT